MKRHLADFGKAISILVAVALLALTASVAGVQAADPDKAVDINRATHEELMSVKGIGETLAKRIIEFREENGPFRQLEDLLKVQGIGERSFEKIRPFLTVGKS